MQIRPNLWITRAVVTGVLIIGAWSLQMLVEPDSGPSAPARSPSSQLACSDPSRVTMTYNCRRNG